MQLLTLLPAAETVQAQSIIAAEKIGSKIDVYFDGRFFTSYTFSENEKYPFFYPVNGPSGAIVMSKGKSKFSHHSTLFFGADFVNGGNYWQEGFDRGHVHSVNTQIIDKWGRSDYHFRAINEILCCQVKNHRPLMKSIPMEQLFVEKESKVLLKDHQPS